MSEFSVVGSDLKKLLKISSKGPIPFAYCHGSTAEASLFGLHRKKPPEIIAKALRAEGEGNKVAFGTAEMEGKLVSLRCDRVLPALAKSVKRFFKANKVMKNVCVLDADGNVLEEDIEDLPDELEEEDTEDTGLDAADDTADIAPDQEADDTAKVDATTAQEALRSLAARAKLLQPRVAAAPNPAAEKLIQAFGIAVAHIKAQEAEAAGKTFDMIEQVLARLGNTGAESDAVKDNAPDAAMLAKLQGAAMQMAQRIKALPEGDARALLATQVRYLVGNIREGAAEQDVIGALRKLQQDLKLAEANAGDASTPARDPMDVWNAAKEMTDVAISALQSKLRQIPHPDLERISEMGLNGITEGNQVALMKRLFEFKLSSGEARIKAADALRTQSDEYRKFLAGNELITLCDRNPFGVAVNLRATLGQALDEIDRATAA
jgi:hypothetical protein